MTQESEVSELTGTRDLHKGEEEHQNKRLLTAERQKFPLLLPCGMGGAGRLRQHLRYRCAKWAAGKGLRTPSVSP